MSVISATVLTFSCPSNQNQNSKFSHKSSIPLHIFRAHCSLRIPVSSYHHQISSLHIFRAHCSLRIPVSSYHRQIFSTDSFNGISKILSMEKLVLIDLDPATAKLAIPFLGPFLSAFGFLFIVRIVMSWYPKLPVEKFPYVIAYAPTEPLLVQTRKVIPPLGGVDVTPVVWFGLISFLNEILVGPQGLLVLLSQQV